jgi:anti-sigma B factor antagonist
MTLRLAQRRVEDAVILDLDGRMVVGDDTALLRDSIRELLDHGTRKLVLNLAGCQYVDSAGLAELTTALVRIRRANGHLRLVNLTKRVHDLLRVTRLLPAFAVDRDEVHALNSMK